MTGFSRERSLAVVRRVRVGSVNEPKLAAVRSAIGAYAPDATVLGVKVASGVSEQPVGFEEIIRGARNRAAEAVKESIWSGTQWAMSAALAMALALLTVACEQKRASKLALLIGVQEYDGPASLWRPLKGPRNDVDLTRQ